VVGNKLPAIRSAIGMGLMARYSSDGFDQWVFAIDRRRHVPHGKTDFLSDSSARSDGSALTIVVFGERHLRHVLLSYMNYYNETRTHLSLDTDAPLSRTVKSAGRILCRPVLGGLHHQCGRI
jgi:hypothetical protein